MGLDAGLGRLPSSPTLAQADLGVTPDPVLRVGAAVTSTGGVGRGGGGGGRTSQQHLAGLQAAAR